MARWIVRGICRLTLFGAALSACGNPPGSDSDVTERNGAVTTFPWKLVGPSGMFLDGNFSVRYNGSVSETKVFPRDAGSGPSGILRLAAVAGGIFEWCKTCAIPRWDNLTQTLVPTHSPRLSGEGLAATTFVSDPANSYQTIVFGTAGPIAHGTQVASGIWRGTKSNGVWSWTNPIAETSVGNVRRLLWGGGGFTTRVHAATDNGYWRSDDGGITWTQFNAGCSGNFQLTDIADYRGQYLVAVGRCSTDTRWNLWKRAPGQNWTKIHTLTSNANFAWLAVGATNAYMLVARFDNTGVVERYDGTNYFSSTTAISQIGGQIISGYNGAIAVDPNSDSTVYAGAQFLAKNTTSGTGTWTSVPVTHADLHHLYFTRSSNTWSLWASSDAGTHPTTSYTSANPSWDSANNNAPISHVTAMDVARWNNETWVYAQTWDSGMANGIDDDSGGILNGFLRVLGSPFDGGAVTMDPGAPGVVWASDGNAIGHPGFMSTDNFVSQNVPMNQNGVFIHDQVPQVFLYAYSGSGTEIFRSTSPQTVPISWSKYADGPPDSCPCYTAFGVGRWNGTGSNLYVSPANLAGIWRAPPGSTTFTHTSAPDVSFEVIKGWVSTDATASQTAYAAGLAVGLGPATLVRTRDGGATWTNIVGDLPATAVHDIVADPVNPDIVFVSVRFGGNGIYRTTNASAATPHWSPWVAGLPAGGSNAPANIPDFRPRGTQLQVLDLGPSNRWLYAAFWGGSIWKRRTDATD
jgi:hypothetical protein